MLKKLIYNKKINLSLYKDNISKIPIDEIKIKYYYYNNRSTVIYSENILDNDNIEHFLCKAYKSFSFNQFPDKSVEWRLKNSVLVLEEIMEEKPSNIILDSNICISKILNYYIGKKNFNLLDIDFENIQDIAFLGKKIKIDCESPQSDITIVFTTLNKIYMLENCIDC